MKLSELKIGATLLVSSLKSPSRSMTIKQLLQIQQNNYLGADGTEYVPEEVDSRIWELGAKLADTAYDREMKRQKKMAA